MKYLLKISCILTAIVLSACGGGGGSSGGDVGNSNGSYSINLDKQSLEFSAPLGANIPAQQITASFKGDGVLAGVPPGATLPSWLSIDENASSSTSASFTISVSVGQFSEPTIVQTTLRFVTGKLDGSGVVYKDLTVILKLLDVVSTDKESLDFASVFGDQLALTLPFKIMTRDTTLGWTISSNQSWLTLSESSGIASKTVYANVNKTSLVDGAHSAELTIKDSNGFSKKITVTLSLQPRVVYAHKRSMAFVETGNIHKLTGKIEMVDTADLVNPDWQVAADQPWIEIVGNNQKSIDVKINPQLLANGMHYGVISVSSSFNSKVSIEAINVGFYKTAENSVEGNMFKINSLWDINSTGLNLAEDPLRPYIYMTDTGKGIIRKVNVHTGAEESSLSNVEGESFAGIAMSSDGNTLYAHSVSTKKIYKYNFKSNTWTSMNITTGFLNPSNLDEIHPNGKSLIVIHQAKIVVDANTGQTVFTDNNFYGNRYAVSGDQQSIYSIQTGISAGGRITRMETNYNLLTNVLLLKSTHFFEADFGSATDIATNYDGSQINTTSGSYHGIPVYLFDSESLMYQTDWGGRVYPISVEIADNKISYIGMRNYFDDDTVYAYDSQGILIHTYTIGASRYLLEGDKGMRLSGDGTRLLLISTENSSGDKTSLWGFNSVTQ